MDSELDADWHCQFLPCSSRQTPWSLSKENSHVSIKTPKHLRPALTPGAKAMHPSLQHLQGRKRHPDEWAQFLSACNHLIAVQPKSSHKNPRHPPMAQNELPNPFSEWTKEWMCLSLKQGHSQPSSACGWTLDPPSNISTPVFPRSLHHPNRVFAQHTVHLKGKPSTLKAAAAQQA